MPRRAASRDSPIVRALPVFAALGDETRLALVTRLCAGGPQSITRLSEGARVSRQAITKHLVVLERAGLARRERSGRDRLWTLQTQRLAEVHHALEQISRDWDGALGRLKDFVETDARD